MRNTLRSTLTLMLLCASVSSCTTLEYLVTGKPEETTAPRSIMTCPVHPDIYVTKAGDSYQLSKDAMKDLLHYITDLEYAAGCDESRPRVAPDRAPADRGAGAVPVVESQR